MITAGLSLSVHAAFTVVYGALLTFTLSVPSVGCWWHRSLCQLLSLFWLYLFVFCYFHYCYCGFVLFFVVVFASALHSAFAVVLIYNVVLAVLVIVCRCKFVTCPAAIVVPL